jgi:hypothetical protein
VDDPPAPGPLIGIVGPCKSGKTTLERDLNASGYRARAISQEHSYVPHMWQVIGQPDLLIYLDVSYAVAQSRRPLNWLPADLDEQHRRLRHARDHCDFYLDTDPLSAVQVYDRAVAFLRQRA